MPVSVKFAEVAPCGTTTEAGTVAVKLVVASVTTVSACAGAESVTVPVVVPPAFTELAAKDRDVKATAPGCGNTCTTLPPKSTM